MQETKDAQSDVLKVFSKYVGKNQLLSDAKSYHKSLFAARNADAIANHFYEQGKADALKNSVAKSKNIKMDPRQTHKEVKVDGFKYKILGDSSSDFKVKLKNKN